MIEKSQAPPLNELLPGWAVFAQAEDLFPQKKGILRRLFGKGTSHSAQAASSEPLTPAIRYVNLMLFQMFKEGLQIRVLRRSEPLPALASGAKTVEAPPLEDILSRLKTMCRFDPQAQSTPTEGTMHITFAEGRTSTGMPHKALCHFDDNSDARCQIRLERIAE